MGPRLAQALLTHFHAAVDAPVELTLACVASANIRTDGAPATLQLVLDLSTGLPHPWSFEDRGPELPRRFAWGEASSSSTIGSYCGSGGLLHVWRPPGRLVLPAFDATLGSWQALALEGLLRLPDAQLLEKVSTSPAHEPNWFAEGE